MADTVAIVGIVSGATVAVTVPFINAVLERQRLRWQGNEDRLQELRVLIDSSAADMIGAHELIWDLAVRAEHEELDENATAELEKAAAELTARYEAIKALGMRIRLRLGSHKVVSAHGKVEGVVAQAEIIVPTSLDRGKRVDATQLWSQRRELTTAIGEFEEAVRDLIGPIREPG